MGEPYAGFVEIAFEEGELVMGHARYTYYCNRWKTHHDSDHFIDAGPVYAWPLGTFTREDGHWTASSVRVPVWWSTVALALATLPGWCVWIAGTLRRRAAARDLTLPPRPWKRRPLGWRLLVALALGVLVLIAWGRSNHEDKLWLDLSPYDAFDIVTCDGIIYGKYNHSRTVPIRLDDPRRLPASWMDVVLRAILPRS